MDNTSALPDTTHLLHNKSDAFYSILRSYHNYEIDYADEALDQILGITPDIEKNINEQELNVKLGFEQFVYEGSPYSYIRQFLHSVKPTNNDTIYDLGAGYGRVVLYCALITPSSCRGVEIVQKRVDNIVSIIKRFSLSNANVVCKNVLDEDYADGNIFFLFNPFSEYTFWTVLDKLATIARKKQIKIGAWGGGMMINLATQKWLKELPLKPDPNNIYLPTIFPNRMKIYESV